MTKRSLEKVIKEALSNVPDTEGTKRPRLRKRKMTIFFHPPLVTEGRETQPRPEERVTPGHDRRQPGFAGRALPRPPMRQDPATLGRAEPAGQSRGGRAGRGRGRGRGTSPGAQEPAGSAAAPEGPAAANALRGGGGPFPPFSEAAAARAAPSWPPGQRRSAGA